MTKRILRGADRRGWQAKNLLEDLKADKDVYIDKPAVMIDTMRIVGDDLLTAADIALYEKLIAVARYNGIVNDTHAIPTSDAMRYIDVRHVSRLLDSLERITRTVVRYDFRTESYRRRGSLPLLLAEVRDDVSAGTSMLHFEIPLPVRECILAARQYTMLNVTPFSRFKCRYASRLYPYLALRSGMTEGYGKTWEVRPQELAERLGFPMKDGKLHYGSFERRCLRPALQDLDWHALDFDIQMSVTKSEAARGRPVELITFHVSKSRKSLVRTQSQKLSSVADYLISSHDAVHTPAEIPSKLYFGKAARKHGVHDVELVAGWLAALDRAKAYPDLAVVPNLIGSEFLEHVAKDVNDAFEIWLSRLAMYGMKIDKTRLPVSEVTKHFVVAPRPSSTNELPARSKLSEFYFKTFVELKIKLEGHCVYQPHIKKTWADAFFYAEADPDAYVWHCIYEHLDENDQKNLRNTTLIMRKMEITALKRTLHTIVKAVLEWDLEKMNEVVRAVYAADKNGTLPLKNSSKEMGSRASGTRSVTELAMEYDLISA